MLLRRSVLAPTLLAPAAALTAAVLLAGCGSSGTATTSPTTTAAASSSAAPETPEAACTAYAANTGNPRQVVLSASNKPVLGPAVALVTIDFRNTVSALDVPSDPQLSAGFAEVVAAVDQLTQQLADGLPEGADATRTPVEVDPSRLEQALDDADGLCAARGVQPKENTATTADPSATQNPTATQDPTATSTAGPTS